MATQRSRGRGRYPQTMTSYTAEPTIMVWPIQNIQNLMCPGPKTSVGVKKACVERPTPQKYSKVRQGRQWVTIARPATNAARSHSCRGRLSNQVKFVGRKYHTVYQVW